ncbi:hypothetical protein FNV43_RR13399 [Rhamnella rubrinervis]|uniref:DDE Tnp4 domain-containing protein n=1 Tax=Rhamnella rubrinervis TaxID=2594499 RepID=A0A8K0H127_9ROSA|nr:hypothetical protein FNV43_RR13399 [Rhamnella rubrinervis]
MEFIFVLPGWECSASDSKVLHAISKPNGLRVPSGYYYLVDADYTNGEEFLAPYRGTRYHLSEWRDGSIPSNKQAEDWRGKSFLIYDRLLNIFGKDRATGKTSQVAEDMTNDMNLDEENEAIGIEDLPSSMSVNQSLNSVTQLVRKRKGKSHIDIIAGFSEVSEKMCSSFQQAAKERMEQFTNSIQPIEANYPKYLAIELKRLGFSTKDNLNISKAMRMDPSNVEAFKIIETDAEKIEFALSFKPE